MSVRDLIIQKVNEGKLVSKQVTESSNLYMDLGFDSLSFAYLLIEIEETYSVAFDLTEIETCLEVGRLIALVEDKMRGCGKEDA